MSVPVAVKWALRHGRPVGAPSERRWTGGLATATDQAIPVAKNYAHFEVCFQGFHKNRYAADVTTPTTVRFTVPGGERDRQVSGYQKGHRPREGAFAVHRPEPPPQRPSVRNAFDAALRDCRRTGDLSFECGDLSDLWRELLPEYVERISAITRRAGTLSLGAYELDEFDDFYAALITVCAAHDCLCFRLGRDCGVYPLESAVMVRRSSEWVDVLSALSGVAREKCQAMVSDLTFSVRSIDFHVHPLVALDPASETLALAPPFPLHSRHDENILRVCAQRRPLVYDVTSLKKEAEMREALRRAGGRVSMVGPYALPDPTPDIDLIIADEVASTLVIMELKWIRKTLRNSMPLREH